MGRVLNSHVDALASLESVFKGKIRRIIAVDLNSDHETTQESILVNTEMGPSRMNPIINFIGHNKLPKDKRDEHKLSIKATRV